MRGFAVPADNGHELNGSDQQGPASRPQPPDRASAADQARDTDPPSAHASGQIGRRGFLLGGSAAVALAGTTSLKGLLRNSSPKGRLRNSSLTAADPTVSGQWTAPFNLTMVSIHAVMLHTGQVLLFSQPSNTVGSDALLFDPVSMSITNIALTYQRDIFCGGQTVLSDGRVFIAGGHIYQGTLATTQGVANTTLFDPASNAWTEGPTMDVARWYPTAMQLGDNTVRVFGGTVNTGAQCRHGGLLRPVDEHPHNAAQRRPIRGW